MRTLKELAELIDGRLEGDGTISLTGVADVESARLGQITFLAHEKNIDLLSCCQASAAVVPISSRDDYPLPVIRVRDPYLAIAKIHTLFLAQPFQATGIDARAVVGHDCQIPTAVAIGLPASVR